jgi:hypothetical protein
MRTDNIGTESPAIAKELRRIADALERISPPDFKHRHPLFEIADAIARFHANPPIAARPALTGKKIPCGWCGGVGKIEKQEGAASILVDCDYCLGTGKLEK